MLVCPNLQQLAKSYSGRAMVEKASKGPEDFRPMYTYKALYKKAPKLNPGAGLSLLRALRRDGADA